MQLLDKRINLDLNFEKIIGFAIGYSSWGKTGIKTKQYQLLILCFVIELQTRTTIKEKIVKKDLYKKKKTFIAKFVASLSLLSLLATVTGLYEALNATSGADANALTMISAFFLVICVVLSMFYFAMDPNEKYYVG
jgi:uncharacterized membrane protein